MTAPPRRTSKAEGSAARRPARKIKIALRVPPPLSAEVDAAMERDGYSRKRKSLWVDEALRALETHDPDLSQSLVGDRTQGRNTRQMIVALHPDAYDTMKDLIIRLRLQLPTIEGVQSLVLRSAMRFRIRNPDLVVPWVDRQG